MKNVAYVRKMLEKLLEATSSPVYAVCIEIAAYIELHPKQRDLTIGGLRVALKRVVQEDNVLIEAAFTLTAYPFQALEVRYKLYDERISRVLEELDHSTYMIAKSEGYFIDDDGNTIYLDELHSRIFPYFINSLNNDVERGFKTVMRDE
ncbi:hypothetical protein AXW60_12395 [Yersinia ruckeri]|uniref:Uncharacterized protein n=1 Tax=Serratia proteamaculans TaxID=28151 RepID=A0ABS0TLG7_SERPR|nr:MULTISPECIES: hypothetical protein [Yersiniaceae]KFE38446.1 DNA polymerase I [Yersinia ruckeri]MBI6179193.1 hypothetical protein [Serratia proteamaculans]OJB98181.1 hypothetical protein AXW60_12395 [Yersinia ruckeri]